MSGPDSEDSTWLLEGGNPEIHSASEDVQCASYPGLRILRGGIWTQGEEQFLPREKEEELIARFSMSTWFCGVCTLNNRKTGEPCNASYPLANLFSAGQYVDLFIVCGENSDDGVFHNHFLLKTLLRVDSLRRSILNACTKTEYTFNICKLARCRFWLGMFSYMLKNPLCVYASNEDLGYLAFTLIERGEPIKYLKQTSDEGGREVVRVINSIIRSHDCKSTEHVYLRGGVKLLPFLHLSTLDGIIRNCLQYTLALEQSWDPLSFKYAPLNDPSGVHRILMFQGIDIEYFDLLFWRWITRRNGKKNTLIFIGPSNTGKTCFIRGLIQLVPSGSLVNTSSAFYAEGICGKSLGYWEEPLLTPENAESFKQISEGIPIMLPQKFRKPFHHPGCPIIITTNHAIWRFCESERTALLNRCEIIHFYNPIGSSRGCSASNCHHRCWSERSGFTCRINWSSNRGNLTGESTSDSDRNSGSCGSQISRCGRWWCGRDNDRCCRSCRRTTIQRADPGRHDIGASTSTSRNDRSNTRDSSRSPRDRIQPGGTESLLRSKVESGHSPSRISRRIRTRCRNGRGLGSDGDRTDAGRSGEPDLECKEVLSGGEQSGTDTNSSRSTTPETGEICSCVIETSPIIWQCYLCYLACKYD